MLCSIRLTQRRMLIITTEMLVNADQQVTSLIKAIEEFKNPEVEMRDPQKEAAKVLKYIKGEQEWDLL